MATCLSFTADGATQGQGRIQTGIATPRPRPRGGGGVAREEIYQTTDAQSDITGVITVLPIKPIARVLHHRPALHESQTM